jgi:hypothetical protein
MSEWVEIPAPADAIQDRAGNVIADLPVTLTLKSTGAAVTHAADTDGTGQSTGGLQTRADGSIGTAGGRRYIRSGDPVELTIDHPIAGEISRLLQPIDATIEKKIAVTILSTGASELQASIDEVEDDGGGTLALRRDAGVFNVPAATQIVIPNGVTVRGEGERSAIVLQLADATSGVLVKGRGGRMDGITINGGGVATRPLLIDYTVAQRVFDLDIRESGGDGAIFSGAQNCRARIQTDRSLGSALVFRRGARNNYVDLYAEKFARYAIEQLYGLDVDYPDETVGGADQSLENHVVYGPWERAGYADDGDALGLVGLFGGTLFVGGGEWNLTGKDDGTYRPVFHLAYDAADHGGDAKVNRLVVSGGRALSNVPARLVTAVKTETPAVGSDFANHEIVFEGYFQFQNLQRGYHVADATVIHELGRIDFTNVAAEFVNNGGSFPRDRIVRSSRKSGHDTSFQAGAVRGYRTKLDADTQYRVGLGPDRLWVGDGATALESSPSVVAFAGNPEGSDSARSASLGLQTDGLAGFEVWKKSSGTGVSGWAPLTQVISTQTIATDANFTLTPTTSPELTLHTGTLTADRTITLSNTNAQNGFRWRITRTGAGAFNLSVGGLKNLATNQWCEVTRIGGAWVLTAFGSL